MRVVLITGCPSFSGFILVFVNIQKHLINMLNQPVQPVMGEVFGYCLSHCRFHHWFLPVLFRPASFRPHVNELLQPLLAGCEFIGPAIAVVKHLGNYIGERHVPTLEREQRLIHLRIDPDRTSFTCPRHNNHFVVTEYKYIA